MPKTVFAHVVLCPEAGDDFVCIIGREDDYARSNGCGVNEALQAMFDGLGLPGWELVLYDQLEDDEASAMEK